jgi:hypothetical protein
LQIGRTIYYERLSGNFIHDSGEREGAVRETTPQESFPDYDPVTMDFIDLEFGERAEEFNNIKSISVNPATKELIIIPQ